MFRRRSGSALALALLAVTTGAEAAPPSSVRLHLAEDSTCEGTQALPSRLAGKGIMMALPTTDGAVDVDVRAITTPSGADAALVIRRGTSTAMRSLTAPTCDEVLDALVFALGLALEQPIEPELPPVTPPLEPERPSAAPAIAKSHPIPTQTAIAWGGGAGAGVFVGASPAAALAVVVHADVESRAPGLFAPSARIGAAFVLPSSTTASEHDVAFALQAGTLDGCPVRVGSERFALRPCIELQAGRLQSRSSSFVGNRLASSPWLAVALAMSGRVQIARGVSIDVDLAAGSPLIQDVFFVGDQRVFGAGPFLLSATAGVGVHFP